MDKLQYDIARVTTKRKKNKTVDSHNEEMNVLLTVDENKKPRHQTDMVAYKFVCKTGNTTREDVSIQLTGEE